MRFLFNRHVGASFSMLFGGWLILSGLMLMNQPPVKKKSKKHGPSQSFMIKQPKRKPPKRRTRRRRRRRPRRNRVTRAPAPRLSTALSSVPLGMPNVSIGGMDGADDQLLGGAKDARNLVMTEKTVDQPPRPVHRVAPRHPPRAIAQNISGYVLFKLLISAEGNVEQVQVLRSKPAGVFESVATAAIQSWRFRPAMYKGQPVKIWIRQRLTFRLQ